jgi:cytochrome b subunit of formate dehydrogenase
MTPSLILNVRRRASPTLRAGLLAAWLSLLCTGWTVRAMSDADCLMCHEDPELTQTDERGRERSLFVDPALLQASVHAENSCADCHSDITDEHPDDERRASPVDCSSCHADESDTYGASVHGLAARNGLPGAASCTDCHGTHSVLRSGFPDALMNRRHLAETCGACHEEQAREVQESVHGVALARGQHDAPTCTDCHAEHAIEDLRNLSPMKVSELTCSRCHASERINSRYRLPTDRVRTFLGSYHGLAARLGSTRAANCASCHGVHRILPSSDPSSTVHPDNLVATCGHCHPGATANFALGKVHVDLYSPADDLGSTVNWWVRRIYLGIIFGTIGVFLLHNGLIWWRKVQVARRALDPKAPLRMDYGQRIQHGLLALSFIILAISGFALKFPDSWLAWILGSDEGIRRWTHRGAALVMVVLSLYHVAHVLFTPKGRQLLRDFLPRRQDLREGIQNLRYGLGRHPRPAHPASRFGYVEKLEYWAVVWGTIIMSVTGFMVWFPVQVTWLFPRWIIDVATTIHYYEAILACLAILVWHFYHVMFDPDVYPLNWAFWDGRDHTFGRVPAAMATSSPPASGSAPSPAPISGPDRPH